MHKLRPLLLPVVLVLLAGVLLPSPGRAAGAPEPDLSSERVLVALQRMAAWGAAALGEPGPGPDFVDSTRRYFAKHPQPLVTAAMLARADKLYPCLDRALARMSPAGRASWVRRLRPVVDGGEDKPLMVAAAMSGFADHECRAERSSGHLRGVQARMAEQTIMFNQLAMQNMWRRYNMGQMAHAFGNPN